MKEEYGRGIALSALGSVVRMNILNWKGDFQNPTYFLGRPECCVIGPLVNRMEKLS